MDHRKKDSVSVVIDFIQSVLAKSSHLRFGNIIFGYNLKVIPLIINTFIVFIID